MKVLLANPRGFCAGVVRAIDIVDLALEKLGAPIYVRHEVVHNRRVVDDLRRRGTVFVEELREVPDGSTVVFSAHGVAKAVVDEAKQRRLTYFDATCPLVTKVHVEVARLAKLGWDCVVVGHRGHPEVEGTLGRFDRSQGGNIHLIESEDDVADLVVRDPTRVGYVTQTTLSMDDTQRVVEQLRARFPSIAAPRRDDICYATQNRQDAVRRLAARCHVVLVVGSTNSSNSNRLRELAELQGVRSYLIDGAADIQSDWIAAADAVGVTAGASAPEAAVAEVIERLRALGGRDFELLETTGAEENVRFGLPAELKLIARSG